MRVSQLSVIDKQYQQLEEAHYSPGICWQLALFKALTSRPIPKLSVKNGFMRASAAATRRRSGVKMTPQAIVIRVERLLRVSV